MDRILLESTPHDGLKNGTHLDVEVYYTKVQHGYYLSVQPVTHERGMKSVVLLTGEKKLLMQTKRFSKKQFEQAVELGRLAAPELIEHVLKTERAA